MKLLHILFITICFCQSSADEIDDKIDMLNVKWNSIYAEIAEIKSRERRKAAFEKLREYASEWHPFSFLYTVYGSDELQKEAAEEILIDSVYSAFFAERAHYERTIVNTEGDDERAVELMGRRAETMCQLYPIGDPLTLEEELLFAQFMCRVAFWSPDRVVDALENGLENWKASERVVPLLILAHQGSHDAKTESRKFDSEKVRRLSVIIDSILSDENGGRNKR